MVFSDDVVYTLAGRPCLEASITAIYTPEERARIGKYIVRH